MPKLTLEIPEELIQSLKIPHDEAPARLKRELALRLYEKGLLSFGKARELAGMSKWEFSRLLGKEGIPRRYDLEEFEKDLRTLEKRVEARDQKVCMKGKGKPRTKRRFR